MDTIALLSLIVYLVVMACFAYLLIGGGLGMAWWAAAALERRARRDSSRVENYDLLRTSRFTIPVSVIVPAHNEVAGIVAVVRALLALHYPEFEVIVVNDGSTDETLERLRQAFDLERREVFTRRVLPAPAIRGVYRTAAEPRLRVIDQAWGGKAAALNNGINATRYRYVCCVDGDTIYEPDALLRGMRLVMKDPARVIAVTSHVNPSSYPESVPRGDGAEPRIDRNWLVNFQHIEYLRAFLDTRLAWSRGNCVMVTAGAFMIYRRDVLEELGGFSSAFTCEDIELTFRAHERYRREQRDYEILSLPDTVGYTEVPQRLGQLVSQRARWQRVILETTWHYRRMFANPRYGRVGLVGLPYYVFYEALSPFVECLALATMPLAWALGVLGWRDFAVLIGIVALANGIFTSGAILHDERLGRYPLRDVVRLLLLGPLEIVLYRPVLLYARCRGVWQFVRGHKTWDRFDRNVRPPTAVSVPSAARG